MSASQKKQRILGKIDRWGRGWQLLGDSETTHPGLKSEVLVALPGVGALCGSCFQQNLW